MVRWCSVLFIVSLMPVLKKLSYFAYGKKKRNKQKRRLLDKGLQRVPVNDKVLFIEYRQDVDIQSYEGQNYEGQSYHVHNPCYLSYRAAENGLLHKNAVFSNNCTACIVAFVECDQKIDDNKFQGHGTIERHQTNMFVRVWLVIPHIATILCGRERVDGASHTQSCYMGSGSSVSSTGKYYDAKYVSTIAIKM